MPVRRSPESKAPQVDEHVQGPKKECLRRDVTGRPLGGCASLRPPVNSQRFNPDSTVATVGSAAGNSTSTPDIQSGALTEDGVSVATTSTLFLQMKLCSALLKLG